MLEGASRVIEHDVVESYRHLTKNAKFFVNGGILPVEGDDLISRAKIDGIFIGLNWIAHPDLVRRIEGGKSLDRSPDFVHIMVNKSDDDWETGYTNYA